MSKLRTLQKKSFRKSKSKHAQNTLKFSIRNGFLLYLAFEKKDIAKENGFKFLTYIKAWHSKDYRSAYRVIISDKDIKCSVQLRKFFDFYGEDIWKSIKKIRYALIKIREKCDYAQLEDNRGFSQSDKKIGRELILKPKWDNFDILRAAWIVYIHRKQVKDIFKE